MTRRSFFSCFVSAWSVLAFLGQSHAAPVSLSAEKVEQVSHSKTWLRLLHYKGKESEIDGGNFFLAPIGKKNPKAELLATLEAFSKDLKIGPMGQHPQCAFPERLHFLSREFGLSIAPVPCPKFEEFIRRFNARSLTLVYSSAFPNNPGSMFGHTFFRVNAKAPAGTDQKKLDILDYGINFAAAVPPDDGGFAYMWYGLTGGYPGEFSMVPYYIKVKEYSSSESRDLWEYDLNLSEEETLTVLRHIWELQTTGYFNYYFFDKNCSYRLLTVLEVARPDWDLSDFAIYAIPAETIKRVSAIPGAVTAVKFRPSLHKKMLLRFDALEASEKSRLSDLLAGSLAPAQVSEVAVLEAYSAYLFYQKQKNEGKLPGAQAERLREVLVRRSELGSSPERVGQGASLVEEEMRPDKAHHPYRLGFSVGGGTEGLFQELSFRTALHDLLNNDIGYIRFSQLEFPGASFRFYPDGRKFLLERVDGLGITSLFPMNFLEKRPSWKAELNLSSPRDLSRCDTCYALHFEGGVGAASEVFNENFLVYAFVLGNVEGGAAIPEGLRGGPKFQLATLANPTVNCKVRLAVNWVTDLFQSARPKGYFQLELDQSYSISRALEIRGGIYRVFKPSSGDAGPGEGKLSLNYYF